MASCCEHSNEINMFQICAFKVYLNLRNKTTISHAQNIFFHVLLITNMFKSLLPSSSSSAAAAAAAASATEYLISSW